MDDKNDMAAYMAALFGVKSWASPEEEFLVRPPEKPNSIEIFYFL
jgi:hypothetical protein